MQFCKLPSCIKMTDRVKNSLLIKKLALQNGFEFCGISEAGFLEEAAPRLENWLKQGMHGNMMYMENYFDKRLDPQLLVPGAKTVVSLMYNYFPAEMQKSDSFRVAKYAYGKDYHLVIKEKLNALLNELKIQTGDIAGRVFVDSAPVLERAWAEKSGLGWIGKHGLLINKKAGSFYFLAEIIIDLDCEPDGPVKDFCGTCTRCVDACPTDAILPDKTLNAGKCISYLTIELKDAIPQEFEGKMSDWIFGCDICQDVCPWNRFSKPHTESEFFPPHELLDMSKADWEELNLEIFQKTFGKSAFKRKGFEGLKQNIRFAGNGNRQN